MKNDGDIDVYQPVISQAGNRYLITEAQSEGDYMEAFDLDCQFLNQLVEEDIFVSLPPQWVK